jgi:hypothetical protein
MRDLVFCPKCETYGSNPELHVCVEYTGPACGFEGCTEPTVSGFYGAPGVGRSRSCKAGHQTGDEPYILTAADVI